MSMQTHQYKKLTVIVLCFILLLSLFALFCLPIASTAFADTQEISNSVILQMTAYEDTAKNQRLYNVALNHISKNMKAGSSVSSVKQLVDFAGNRYTLFELAPIGYMIYHIDSGKFVEYAEDSYSPYLGFLSNLYYGGAMQYYYLQETSLHHTLKNDLSVPSSSMSQMAIDSRTLSTAFLQNRSYSNLNYINNGGSFSGVERIIGVVASSNQAQTRAAARISMTNFFPNLNTDWKMGYRDGGVCGYIATNLVLGYNYFAFDYGLISNSTYVDFANKTMNGPELTNRLLELAGEDPNGSSFSGTYSHDMFVVVGKYLNEVNNYLGWTYSWYFFGTNVNATLNAGYPVAIFGSFKKPNGSSGNINHAVVAYDYQKYGFLNLSTKYRVHYGWSGYSSVWLESPTIGSNFYMRVTS